MQPPLPHPPAVNQKRTRGRVTSCAPLNLEYALLNEGSPWRCTPPGQTNANRPSQAACSPHCGGGRDLPDPLLWRDSAAFQRLAIGPGDGPSGRSQGIGARGGRAVASGS